MTLAALGVTLVGAAACSGDDDDDTAATSTTTTVADTTTTTGETTTTTTATTTTGSPDTTVASDVGEPFELGPQPGDLLAVVGVAAGETLPLRAAPLTDADVTAELEPTTTGLEATGDARISDNTIWYEVSGDESGWAEASQLAYIGLTDDATAEVVDRLGELPEAPSMDELGVVVGEALATEVGDTRVTVTVEASEGDLAEVTVDLTGLADDAVGGYRLHLFARTTADGYGLDTVERTYLCSRGVTGAGLCV
ncbi:MAG: hypothetical protein S0880_03500 [Actinomycetota bacterium]|nr:hypothetical protein [Actinomycetota bacterium]